MKTIFVGILLISLLSVGCIDLNGIFGGRASPSAQATIKAGGATATPGGQQTITATPAATAVPTASASATISIPTLTPTPTPITPTTRSLPTQVIEVTVANSGFTPSTISVKQGTSVILKVTGGDNGSGSGHSFKMLEFNVNIPVTQGKTYQTTFVADKAGTYVYKDSLYTAGKLTGAFTVTP